MPPEAGFQGRMKPWPAHRQGVCDSRTNGVSLSHEVHGEAWVYLKAIALRHRLFCSSIDMKASSTMFGTQGLAAFLLFLEQHKIDTSVSRLRRCQPRTSRPRKPAKSCTEV